MAALATHPQKATFKATEFEVSPKLPLKIRRQFRALCRQVGLERRVVFLNELIKEGALWAVAHVRLRADSRTGLPASCHRHHDRVPAMLMLPSLSTDPESTERAARTLLKDD